MSMTDQDLLKCPLLRGLDPMNRAALMGLLKDSNVKQELEKCLAQHQSAADSAKTVSCASVRQPGDFEKEVHSWNPQRSTWNRSPKE
jgi:hypothetical protein